MPVSTNINISNSVPLQALTMPKGTIDKKIVMAANIRVAVASNSLGKSAAGHTIHRKLQAARAHGFDGVEMAFECLDAHASTFTSLQSRKDRLCAAAKDIYQTASSLGLALVALNPFGAYDGLRDPRDVEVRLQEAELWCQLCQIMHIGIFQVCQVLNLSVMSYC